MEQFIKDNEYPKLWRFVGENPEAVKSYIGVYDSEAAALAALQHQFRCAYSRVRGVRGRSLGLEVHFTSLFIEARAEAGVDEEID